MFTLACLNSRGVGRVLDSYANPRLRLEFSQPPSCPLQVQIMLISCQLTLSTLALASRPVDRFLCGSGANDCVGP